MFQTMAANARAHQPHQMTNANAIDSDDSRAASEAELLAELQIASDNVLRLACKLRTQPDADAADSMATQHALAQRLIGRLLAMPASQG